jgi:hypothetical protein
MARLPARRFVIPHGEERALAHVSNHEPTHPSRRGEDTAPQGRSSLTLSVANCPDGRFNSASLLPMQFQFSGSSTTRSGYTRECPRYNVLIFFESESHTSGLRLRRLTRCAAFWPRRKTRSLPPRKLRPTFGPRSKTSRRFSARLVLLVIASEAKQSRSHKKGLDCFVASLLAMTECVKTAAPLESS